MVHVRFVSGFAKLHLKGLPPPLAIIVVFVLAIGVPLYGWNSVQERNWGYGGSPAAQLDACYFWAVVLLRTIGALALAALLLVSRRLAAIWTTVLATWLAGPPLTFLLHGIFLLAASGGQRSVPEQWSFLIWSCLLPLFVTCGLVGSRRVRQHYSDRAVVED